MYRVLLVALVMLAVLVVAGQVAAQDPPRTTTASTEAKKDTDPQGATTLYYKEVDSKVMQITQIVGTLAPIVLQAFIVLILMGIRSDMNEATKKAKGGS